jgi:transcriptional regulator with XRE-family HTH domain
MSTPTKLAAWRTANGYTLRDLAGLSGFSDSHLSLVENGRRQMTAASKVRLARSVGAEVSDLFDAPDADKVR